MTKDANPNPPHEGRADAEVDDSVSGITCQACGEWYQTWPPCTCQSCEGRVCIYCGKRAVSP